MFFAFAYEIVFAFAYEIAIKKAPDFSDAP